MSAAMPPKAQRPDGDWLEAARNHLAAHLAGDLESAWVDGAVAAFDTLDLAYAQMNPGGYVTVTELRDTLSDLRRAARDYAPPLTKRNAGGNTP